MSGSNKGDSSSNSPSRPVKPDSTKEPVKFPGDTSAERASVAPSVAPSVATAAATAVAVFDDASLPVVRFRLFHRPGRAGSIDLLDLHADVVVLIRVGNLLAGPAVAAALPGGALVATRASGTCLEVESVVVVGRAFEEIRELGFVGSSGDESVEIAVTEIARVEELVLVSEGRVSARWKGELAVVVEG